MLELTGGVLLTLPGNFAVVASIGPPHLRPYWAPLPGALFEEMQEWLRQSAQITECGYGVKENVTETRKRAIPCLNDVS
jgi:hypothetical protein